MRDADFGRCRECGSAFDWADVDYEVIDGVEYLTCPNCGGSDLIGIDVD